MTIRIRHPAIRDTTDTDEEGRFVWARTVHPALPEGASIGAVVTAADGTDIEATGDVFGEAG